MNEISVKYIVVCGILLLSFMQENETNPNQVVEAHIDLIQNENHITVTGSMVDDDLQT